MNSRPVNAALAPGRNSFGFLRYFFALLVIVTHSVALGGFDARIDVLAWWSHNRNSVGGLAVGGFFVVSGYLITQSWHNTPSGGRYLWKRALRILPGFWVCLLVTAFVFGPIAWRHEHGTLTGYLGASDSPFGYVVRNIALSVRQTDIAGLLRGTPLASSSEAEWNGSLWTLQYEAVLYLGVFVLGLLTWRRRPWLILPVTGALYAGLLAYGLRPQTLGWSVGPLAAAWLVQLGFLFAAAGAVATYGHKIPMDDRLGVLAVVAVLVLVRTSAWIELGYPALVYAVLWAAARIRLPNWDRRVDLTYGTYIYAFPLQMLLAEFGFQRHGPAAFILASIALASLFALLSWELVEKHALRCKGMRLRRRATVAA